MTSSCLPDSQKFRTRFVYHGIHQDEVEAVRRRQNTTLIYEEPRPVRGFSVHCRRSASRLPTFTVGFFALPDRPLCGSPLNQGEPRELTGADTVTPGSLTKMGR